MSGSYTRAVKTFSGVLLSLLFLAGCGAAAPATKAPLERSPSVSSTKTPARYDFDGHGANVSARKFGKSWPLTVKSGRVNCIPVGGSGVAAVFTSNGDRRYALNGTAKSSGLGFKSIRPIWANAPEVGPGLKKDISVLIDVCSPLMR